MINKTNSIKRTFDVEYEDQNSNRKDIFSLTVLAKGYSHAVNKSYEILKQGDIEDYTAIETTATQNVI